VKENKMSKKKVQGKGWKVQGKKEKHGTGDGSQAKGKRQKEEVRRNTEPGERSKVEGKWLKEDQMLIFSSIQAGFGSRYKGCSWVPDV
jgi:hypothetical protein